MRVRQLAATAVAITLAVVGLTACTTKVGAAAIVGGDRISDNSVQRYVQPGAVPYSDTSQDSTGQSQTATVVPRVQVLDYLVTDDIFQKGLQANGGPATAAESTAAEASLLNGQPLSAVQAAVEKQGYTARFAQLAVDYQVHLTVLEKRLKDDGSGAATVAALNKLKIPVQVNPRYGVWSSSSYTITAGATDGLPDFVKLIPVESTATAG